MKKVVKLILNIICLPLYCIVAIVAIVAVVLVFIIFVIYMCWGESRDGKKAIMNIVSKGVKEHFKNITNQETKCL
jgi:predicted ABC-type exoprotein transport system permease subunit